EPSAEALPAASVARNQTVVASSPTTTGSVYADHSPSDPIRYSVDATPDPASEEVTVTVRASASTVPFTSGGVPSSWRASSVTSETLPASSVARTCTVWSPSPETDTGSVYADHSPPSTATSIRTS